MKKNFYWTLLLTSVCSLSGLTVAIANEQVDVEDLPELDNLDRTASFPLENLDPSSLSLADRSNAHQELNAIANVSLVTATLEGKLKPDVILELKPESVTNQTVAIVKEFEGFRSQAYLDTDGTPVIGYGQSRINGRKVRMGDRITVEAANKALEQELAVIQKEILSVVKVELSPNQLGVIASLAYNTGVHAIKRSTLISKLNRQDYTGAANEFVRWDKGNLRGRLVKMPGLTRRRQRERQLFLSPQAPTIAAMGI